MFFLTRPKETRVRELLALQQGKDFSYSQVGATRGEMPRRYRVLRGRTEIGRGSPGFEAAVAAVRRWRMFDIPEISICWPDAAIEVESAVGVLVRHFGFWSLNFCRIVYVVDEDARFGFAYGTLREHAESGGERFLVEWDRESDVVSYDIVSFSRQ